MTGLLTGFLVLLPAGLSAADPYIPESLKPWVGWVREQNPARECALDPSGSRTCAFLSELTLDAQKTGAKFSLDIDQITAGEVMLPGGGQRPEERVWPENVVTGTTKLPVFSRDGRPAIWLPAGRTTVQGVLHWQSMPKFILAPQSIGLIRLTVTGVSVSAPKLSASGELWLGDTGDAPAESDSLRIQVLRELVDGSPARLRTQLRLEVGGRARTENLGPVLPPAALPYSISGGLGYQFSDSTGLKVQLRPGVHTLMIESVYPSRLDEYVKPAPSQPDWPDEEYLAFVADESFRHVQPEGGAQIDRSQIPFSDVPQDMLPANALVYLLKDAEKITFKAMPREKEAIAPNTINLRRNIRLDLVGGGATVQDQLNGSMNQRFRLNMLAEAELGAVRQNGTEQLISTDPESKLRGVELRERTINLESDARIENFSQTFSAVGWDTKVDSLNISLSLPPGYKLFAAFGVDEPPMNGWLHSWTLLEIFFVFLVTIAVLRMFDVRAAAVALAALVLTHNQFTAPGSIWIILLCLVALLKVIPEGSGLRKFTLFTRTLFLIALGFQIFSFIYLELRESLHPQLSNGFFGKGGYYGGENSMVQAQRASDELMMPVAPAAKGGVDFGIPSSDAPQQEAYQGHSNLERSRSLPTLRKSKVSQALRIDPKAAVQAGPGVPDWRGSFSTLNWRGPVRMDEKVRVVLITPSVNLLLGFMRILFVLLFAQLFFPVTRQKLSSLLRGGSRAFILLLTITVAMTVIGKDALAEDYPSDALLKQLSDRISRDECRNDCVSIQSLKIKESGDALRLELLVGSRGRTSLTLPGPLLELPVEAVLLSRGTGQGSPVSLRRDARGFLQARLEDGVQELVLTTAPLQRSSVSLQLPAQPGTVSAELSHWAVDGLAPNGGVSGSLRFTRLGNKSGDDSGVRNESETLPEYFIVERTVTLAFPWETETRISRFGNSERSTSLRVPLLEGERLTDKTFREENGEVLVQIPRGTTQAAFAGSLSEAEKLRFVANKGGQFTEVWRVSCSPVFRCELESGLQPTATMNATQQEFLFQPFPADEAVVKIVRPPGASGQTATIDATDVQYELGRNNLVSRVQIDLRSTQGGTQKITLPEDAALRTLKINGADKNLRPTGRELFVPIAIGRQTINLEWEQPWAFRFVSSLPSFQLGMPGVNLRESIRVPRERWVLFSSGPGVGSVVFFWPKLLFVIICAMLLGRISALHLSTTGWLLLGIGLVPLDNEALLVPIIWFGLNALRCMRPPKRRWLFNLLQIVLAGWTFAFLVMLYSAVESGLLHVPNMRVQNPAGLYGEFVWYLDRFPLEIPTPTLWSVPLTWVYRPLTFLWAGWLVFSLINWLKWGWDCFSTEGLWKKRPPKPPKDPAPAPASS